MHIHTYRQTYIHTDIHTYIHTYIHYYYYYHHHHQSSSPSSSSLSSSSSSSSLSSKIQTLKMIEIYPWGWDSDKYDPRQNVLSESPGTALGESLGNHIDKCKSIRLVTGHIHLKELYICTGSKSLTANYVSTVLRFYHSQISHPP